MASTLSPPPPRTLFAVAAPAEARAVAAAFNHTLPDPLPLWQTVTLSPAADMVITGVGKAAAGGGAARALNPSTHRAIISLGIAGSLSETCPVGHAILATRSDLVDEGLLTPNGFQSLDDMGFAPFPDQTTGAPPDPALLASLQPLADILGPIATLSTCSGTRAAAHALAQRGYLAEAMEGAAVALVAAHLGTPFAELRVISNTTGDRSTQRWNLAAALQRLTHLAPRAVPAITSA